MDNASDGNNRALDGSKLMMNGQASTGAYSANAMTPVHRERPSTSKLAGTNRTSQSPIE